MQFLSKISIEFPPSFVYNRGHFFDVIAGANLTDNFTLCGGGGINYQNWGGGHLLSNVA